jgi:hypothetical protein
MTRFHFNIDEQRDVDGHELSGLADAKCEALKLAAGTICERASEFWDKAEWTMTVTDEHGLTLFQIQIIGTDAPAIYPSSSRRAA